MISQFPFDPSGMNADQADLFMDIYLSFKKKYTVEIDFDFKIDIQAYYTFSNEAINDCGPVFNITNGGRQFYLSFPEIKYHVSSGRIPISNAEYQMWSYCKLKQDYGHILIKNETFLDEIHDLIHRVDIDFSDDAEFSKKFWVASDDKEKATMRLTPRLRDLIKTLALPQPVIEIKGNDCIIGQQRVVTKDACIITAEFIDKLLMAF